MLPSGVDRSQTWIRPAASRVAARRTRGASAGTAVRVQRVNHVFMKLAHRVICLDRGRVIASGTPGEIRRNSHVIAAYLGEAEPEH